jgi:K+ transporter
LTGPVPPPPPPPGVPYGQPPMGAPVPQSNTAKTLGIIGIIVGVLCCSPAGIVLGILSMKKAKEAGQPTTLGMVALIVSTVALVVGIIVAILNITAAGNAPSGM